jgi:hypothetical protein
MTLGGGGGGQLKKAVILTIPISTVSKPSFMTKKVRVECIFSSTYSVKLPVHKFSICFTMCHRICEQLYYMDVHAAFALNFVLMMQTCPSAVQVRPVVCLEASPILHQFHLHFPLHGSLTCSRTA